MTGEGVGMKGWGGRSCSSPRRTPGSSFCCCLWECERLDPGVRRDDDQKRRDDEVRRRDDGWCRGQGLDPGVRRDDEQGRWDEGTIA